MKSFLQEFCACVHPDSWDDQEELFDAIIYEEVVYDPEEMIQIVEEFHASGREQSCPALTARRVLAFLEQGTN